MLPGSAKHRAWRLLRYRQATQLWSALNAYPTIKLPSGDTRWHYGQPMNVNHLGRCGIEDIPYFLSFRSRPM
jgi:hypothetical protein